MQYFYIWEDLSGDKIPIVLEQLEKINIDKPLIIIIDTNGWESTIFDIIYQALYKHHNYHIHVYQAMSNWLILLDKLYKKASSIYIYNTARFAAHLCAIPVYYWDGGVLRQSDYENYKKEIAETTNAYTFNFFTEKEQSDYLKWEDIYIMPNRIKRIYGKKET